ncbi:ABC superfamily ATP binding cassette transporter, permease protein [Paramagnetospirillum caucaseum]|uniref:ABC superfamily ATP binding cassette transporter, permease protein n=1 Tax=Paramagnetospirillum caucaseum TaxID=1244869 RepID=M3A929_9PROT|nr:branched-chain amino acid ABC transporter permease [Paramagnetospirillum caucaseum]EME69293.1 ABC superfamily ATP binding cassette transporter, permease protein [Paramagnetospirillum caucaseum]
MVRNRILGTLLAIALLALPPVAQALGEPFYIGIASRMLVFALAAMSLDLILGYGGMVCFGHAAFIGIGAYVVGILGHHAAEETLLLGFIPGTSSGWITWPLAMLCAGIFAFLVGAVSIRTQGLYFIMITLAFAQMAYFFFVTLKGYGGDDGLRLPQRSQFSDLISLRDKTTFYYVALGVLTAVYLLLLRVTRSRFGMVLRGAKENERRMLHIGVPTYRYRLAAFTIAGALAGLAGALMANQANFVSPAMMHWTRSGELIVMVILGGVGSLLGPAIGAVAFLSLEEVLSAYTEHWQIALGPLLLAVIYFARRGIYGALVTRRVL